MTPLAVKSLYWRTHPETVIVYERFTDRARKVMQLANQEAQRCSHEQIRPEHILLGLVKEGAGRPALYLQVSGIDIRRVRGEVEKIAATSQAVFMGRLPFTEEAKAVIDAAVAESRSMYHNWVGTEHFLLGIIQVSQPLLTGLGLDTKVAQEYFRALLTPVVAVTDAADKPHIALEIDAKHVTEVPGRTYTWELFGNVRDAAKPG